MRLYLMIAILLLAGSAQATNSTVCPNGCDYSNIQAAVVAASPGDELHIISGAYHRVVLDKPLRFWGGTWGTITDYTKLPSIHEIYKCGYSLEETGSWYGTSKEIDECVSPLCKNCQKNDSTSLAVSNPISGQKTVASDTALNPNYTSAEDWYNKGLVLDNQRKYDEAIQAFDKAININPQYAEAWYHKGSDLNVQHEQDEAIKCFNEAIRLNPQYADAWNGKGAALYVQGKPNDALACLDEAIRINPDIAVYWFNKAAALRRIGDNTNANAASAKAGELEGKG